MNLQLWLNRLLLALLVFGSISAIALWIVIFTAKCEGFGCLGLGVAAVATLLLHLLSATAGGVLIWLATGTGRPAKWLLVVEVLNVFPIVGFGLRWLLH